MTVVINVVFTLHSDRLMEQTEEKNSFAVNRQRLSVLIPLETISYIDWHATDGSV